MLSPEIEARLSGLIGDLIHYHKTPSPEAADDIVPHATSARTFGEADRGKYVHVKKGDIITVRLEENDPTVTWHFKGTGSFIPIDDTSTGTSPAIHRFRIKAMGSGLLSFDKTDSRDGIVIDTYLLHMKVGKDAALTDSYVPDMTKVRFFPMDSASFRLCMARLL